MEEQAFINWLNERLARIRRHADSIGPHFFPEPIHHLRTETKRVRAMLRLLSSRWDEETKLPKSYRKLYKIAGSIRDPQIHLTELFGARLPKMPMFSLWLARQMAPGILSWKEKYRQETLDNLEAFCPGLKGNLPGQNELFSYLKNRKKLIEQMFESDPDDESLHQIRKYSKDMLYLLAFSEAHWPEAWARLRHLEPILKRVSDRAGAFNDKRNLLDVSKQFLTDYEGQLEGKDLLAMRTAMDRWATQKELARKRLLASLRALLRRKVVSGSGRD